VLYTVVSRNKEGIEGNVEDLYGVHFVVVDEFRRSGEVEIYSSIEG
jgi:hypothetical protein